jgi:hypothetical protein
LALLATLQDPRPAQLGPGKATRQREYATCPPEERGEGVAELVILHKIAPKVVAGQHDAGRTVRLTIRPASLRFLGDVAAPQQTIRLLSACIGSGQFPTKSGQKPIRRLADAFAWLRTGTWILRSMGAS